MRKSERITAVVVLAVLLVTLFAVMAPGASAGQVTKIQYPQQSVDEYAVVAPTGARNISAVLTWTDLAGNPVAGWPTSEIDLNCQGPSSGDDYADLTDKTWYSGLNPTTTGNVKVTAGSTYYIGVMPWLGDLKYTLTVKFDGAAAAGFPKTGTVYGGGGEVFVPSNGTWHSCVQWWAGATGSVYACWNDYTYERVAGTTFDTMSEGYASVMVAPQPAVTTTVDGSGTNPNSNKWYTVAPEIWPSAATPNVWPAGASVPQPGSLLWNGTGASAIYTYSYPDAAVTGNPVAYMWGSLSSASFSRRNCAINNSGTATVTSTFVGDTMSLIYTKTSSGGTASIKVDGVEKGPLEMYNATPLYGQKATYSGLGAGSHTVVIKSMNPTKPTGSAGWTVYVDAIQAPSDAADPTTTNENNLDGIFTYKWSTINNASASGGNFCISGSNNALAAFTFTGTQLEYKYIKTSSGGKANVYIDGIDKGVLNFYAAAPAFNQVATYSGLTNEMHTVMIKNAGANPPSANTYVYVDAFRVNGVDPWYEN